MKLSAFDKVRLACSYFFIGPGLVYGMFTSRMPALTMQTGADEAQIGLILLCFGVAGMVSLATSAWLIDRFTSRTVLRISAPLLCLALPLVGLASSPLQLGLACVAAERICYTRRGEREENFLAFLTCNRAVQVAQQISQTR